jgi:hypothetical protein
LSHRFLPPKFEKDTQICYSNDDVEQGVPDPRLMKGDLLFLAARMGLTCATMPIAHPNEKKLFNDFMKAHPKPTDKDWRELAKLFKLMTDYKTSHNVEKLLQEMEA